MDQRSTITRISYRYDGYSWQTEHLLLNGRIILGLVNPDGSNEIVDLITGVVIHEDKYGTPTYSQRKLRQTLNNLGVNLYFEYKQQ